MIALIRRSRVPQNTIIQNIGTSKLSKKIQKKKRSKLENVKINNNSINNKFNINSRLCRIFQLDKTQNGKINVVKRTKIKEIPSTEKFSKILNPRQV